MYHLDLDNAFLDSDGEQFRISTEMNKLSPAKHADEAEMGSTSHHIKTAEQVLSYEALVTSLSISSPYIAVGMDDGRLRVCDSNGSLIQNLKDQASGIWAIDLWQDSLVSGGVDSHVRVWDLVTQQVARFQKTSTQR